MAYLGEKQGYLAEVAPNHPFAHSQISFGVKPPTSSNAKSTTPSKDESSTKPPLPAESAEDSQPIEANRY